MTDLQGPPAGVTAGDSWAWADGLAWTDCPSPAFQVSFALRHPATGAGPTVAGVADGAASAWRFTVAAAETGALPAGTYRWAVVASSADGAERLTLRTGEIAVAPDPLATADARTPAERILSAIEATIEGRAMKDADTFTIEGRSIARTPIPDLLRLRAVYQREVAAARGQAGPSYRRIRIR